MSDLFFDNEFRALIPPLQPEEQLMLEAGLKADGNRIPITIWKETRLLLDGHNRYDICTKNNIPLKPAEELSFPDREAAKIWIIDNQLARRNIYPYTRICLVKQRTEILALQAEAKRKRFGNLKQFQTTTDLSLSDKSVAPINTRQAVAEACGISTGMVAMYDVIAAKGTQAQKAELAKGDTTIKRVYNQVRRDTKIWTTPEVAQTTIPVSLYEGLMEDIIPTLGKFNLIIADSPYNRTRWSWDQYPEYNAEVKKWLEICRDALESKYHFFWFCSPHSATDQELMLRELNLPIQSRIVWHRRNMSMGSDSKSKFIDTWEMIFHCGTYELFFDGNWNDSRFDVQTFAAPQSNFGDTKLHPTQKPLELIKRLVKYGSSDGMRVLDPFAGSGTTGAASEGRECHLVESNPQYCEIIRQRLDVK